MGDIFYAEKVWNIYFTGVIRLSIILNFTARWLISSRYHCQLHVNCVKEESNVLSYAFDKFVSIISRNLAQIATNTIQESLDR